MVPSGKARTIRTVIRYAGDRVMVFDSDGEQIPQYQGLYNEVKESILRDAPPDAVFRAQDANDPKLRPVSREEW